LKTLFEMKAELCFYGKGSFEYTTLENLEVKEFEYLYGWVLGKLNEEHDIMTGK